MGSISDEIDAEPQLELADNYGFVICGTDQIGMSAADAGPVIAALNDLGSDPVIDTTSVRAFYRGNSQGGSLEVR